MKSLFTGLISTQSRIKRVEEKAAKHQLKVAVIVRDPATKASVNTFYTCTKIPCINLQMNNCTKMAS